MSRLSRHARSRPRNTGSHASDRTSPRPRRLRGRTRKVVVGTATLAVVAALTIGAPAALAGNGGSSSRHDSGSILGDYGFGQVGITKREGGQPRVSHHRRPANKRQHPGRHVKPSPRPTPSATDTAPVSSSATLFGASVQPSGGQSWDAAVQASKKKYGKLAVVRKYYPGLPGPWDKLDHALGTSIPAVSFKAPPQAVIAGRYDGQLAQWFKTAPTDRPVYWTYFHEPEDEIRSGNFTAAQFRSAWQHIFELSQQAHNAQLKPTLILMCWTLVPASHRNWTDYFPGKQYVSALGWDCYNGAIRKNDYGSPENIFGKAFEISKNVGRPAAFGEFGSKLARGDKGERRAKWLIQTADYLKANHAAYVAYFDTPVGGEFRLLDSWSTDAWRTVCMKDNP